MLTGGTVNGQIDDLLAVGPQRRVVHLVRVGGGRVEHDADVGILGHGLEAVDPLVRGGDAPRARQSEPFGRRVDPDDRDQFHVLGELDHLHHQVGSDVSRSDDRRLHLVRHASSTINPVTPR